VRHVHVHIDRLVLKGVAHGDRHAVAEGLQHELRRVLADRQTVASMTDRREIPRLRVASASIDPSASPRHLGERVAQGIGEEIRR
jgi:hypothetical protein